MENRNEEHKFEQYREHLWYETLRLSNYIELYKHLKHRRQDRLEEMNLAFTFFRTVFSALFSGIVLWVNSLVDPNAERGFYSFLKFAENNLDIFTWAHLQERRGYPNKHWMRQRYVPVTPETIESDRDKLRNLRSLRSFKLRRDKFHAHFDKQYAFDKAKLSSDAPLGVSDFDEVRAVMEDILNRYSAAYDGKTYSLETMTIHDIDGILNILYEYNQRTREKEP